MYRPPNKFSLQSLLIKYGGLMKLITPFTILNRQLNEMDFVRDAMNSKKVATERLHDDYRKMFRNRKHPTIVNGYVWSLKEA